MKKHFPYFHEALRKYYPDQAETLITSLHTTYNDIKPDISFSIRSANPIDKRMDFAASFLALVKVLDKQGVSVEKVREISLYIANGYVQPKSLLAARMKKWPVKLVRTWLGRWLIHYLKKKAAKPAHPEGFAADIITDKSVTFGLGYGVDITECGICKLFEKHQYKQYSSILCDVDYITTSLAGLEMIRTGTIANGAKKCDFRYKLKV